MCGTIRADTTQHAQLAHKHCSLYELGTLLVLLQVEPAIGDGESRRMQVWRAVARTHRGGKIVRLCGSYRLRCGESAWTIRVERGAIAVDHARRHTFGLSPGRV